MRIYEELPCGCLVSEDGGGGLIPCCFNKEDETELHKLVNKMYFIEKKTIKEIYDYFKNTQVIIEETLEHKIDELIEAILEMDFDIEVEQRRGYIIGFQGKSGEEDAKSIIREILIGE